MIVAFLKVLKLFKLLFKFKYSHDRYWGIIFDVPVFDVIFDVTVFDVTVFSKLPFSMFPYSMLPARAKMSTGSFFQICSVNFYCSQNLYLSSENNEWNLFHDCCRNDEFTVNVKISPIFFRLIWYRTYSNFNKNTLIVH